MDFIHNFIICTVLASLFTVLWFTIPGMVVAGLLSINTRLSKSLSVLFVAPALGLTTYGSFSLFFTWLFSFSRITIIVSWLIFNCCVYCASQKWNNQEHTYDFFVDKKIPAISLIIIIACWSLIPIFHIFPFVFDKGLYVQVCIFDHLKMAIVDGIAREGMPALNPFYAPAGIRIPLVYYYGWHFLAAQIKLLTGYTSWQTEVAFTWFTSCSVLCFISAIAIRLSGKMRAGLFIFLFALTASLPDLLPRIMGNRWASLVGYPPGHPLELLWVQLSWAPQHTYAALCVVMLVFFGSQFLICYNLRWQYSLLLGLTAASGFSASAWVGGIGLALSLPMFVFVIFRFNLINYPDKLNHLNFIRHFNVDTGESTASAIPFSRLTCRKYIFAGHGSEPKCRFTSIILCVSAYFEALVARISSLYRHIFFYPLLGSIVLAVVFSMPVIIATLSGDSTVSFPLRLKLYTSTPLFDQSSIIKQSGHFILFWFQFLPLTLGIVYILGMLSVFSRHYKKKEDRTFRLLSIAAILSYLLSVQFVQSCISNNDFGWRCVVVPVLLFMIWASIALSEIVVNSEKILSSIRWNKNSLLVKKSDFIIPACYMLLAIGILTSFNMFSFPNRKDLVLHQDFFESRHAWEKVRELTGPNGLVQANPDNIYKKVITLWPGPSGLSLFANRPTAFSERISVHDFAHSYNNEQQRIQYLLIKNLFSKNPQKGTIQYVYDKIKVKAIIVSKYDDVWQSTEIEKSGYFRLVDKTQNYKIYIAVD